MIWFIITVSLHQAQSGDQQLTVTISYVVCSFLICLSTEEIIFLHRLIPEWKVTSRILLLNSTEFSVKYCFLIKMNSSKLDLISFLMICFINIALANK